MELGELQTPMPRYERTSVAARVKPLYQISNGRALWRLCWSWGWISAAIGCAVVVDHWAGYIPALLIIPGRQVGLFFLVHEGAHHRMFTNRTVSDRLVNLFAAFPIGVTVDAYRAHHIAHHTFLNTSRDPDWLLHQDGYWRWPRPTWEGTGHLAKTFFGSHARRWLAVWRATAPWARFRQLNRIDQILFVCLVAVLATTLTLFSAWLEFAALWVLPQVTVTFFLHELRTVAEHLALPGDHELNATRTVVSSPLERFFVAPFGVNYHLEHHLFPGVPAYNLPKLHQLLLADEPFRSKAHLTTSYLGWNGLRSEIITRVNGLQAPPEHGAS